MGLHKGRLGWVAIMSFLVPERSPSKTSSPAGPGGEAAGGGLRGGQGCKVGKHFWWSDRWENVSEKKTLDIPKILQIPGEKVFGRWLSGLYPQKKGVWMYRDI